jgi:hypothetical protein
MYSTGNIERDKLLTEAINKIIAAGKTASLKLVTRILPDDFGLDQDELDNMLADIAPQDAAPLEIIGESLPIHEVAPAVEIGKREAWAILDGASARLRRAQAAMVLAQETLKLKRGDLAQAIYQWQLMEPKPKEQSFSDLIRDQIAANQKYKMDVYEGKVAPPPRRGKGKSYIDQTNGLGGDAGDFVRRTNQAGAGLGGAQVFKGFRRNGVSQKEAAQINAQRIRDARAKLPSER